MRFIAMFFMLFVSAAVMAQQEPTLKSYTITSTDCEEIRKMMEAAEKWRKNGVTQANAAAILLQPQLMEQDDYRARTYSYMKALGIVYSTPPDRMTAVIGDQFIRCTAAIGSTWPVFTYD